MNAVDYTGKQGFVRVSERQNPRAGVFGAGSSLELRCSQGSGSQNASRPGRATPYEAMSVP